MGFWIYIQPQKRPANNRSNKIGQKFGRLTAISYGPTIGKVLFYLCKCDCGKILNIRGCNLGRSSMSCGCSKRDNVAPVIAMRGPATIDAAINKLFLRYKNDAQKRHDRDFKLTLAEFVKITSSRCHYCGEPPSRAITQGHGGPPYIFNGIDRSNNNLGYVTENVVPCCTQCNYAKRLQTTEEFLAWAERIVRYTKSKQSYEFVDAEEVA